MKVSKKRKEYQQKCFPTCSLHDLPSSSPCCPTQQTQHLSVYLCCIFVEHKTLKYPRMCSRKKYQLMSKWNIHRRFPFFHPRNFDSWGEVWTILGRWLLLPPPPPPLLPLRHKRMLLLRPLVWFILLINWFFSHPSFSRLPVLDSVFNWIVDDKGAQAPQGEGPFHSSASLNSLKVSCQVNSLHLQKSIHGNLS